MAFLFFFRFNGADFHLTLRVFSFKGKEDSRVKGKFPENKEVFGKSELIISFSQKKVLKSNNFRQEGSWD